MPAATDSSPATVADLPLDQRVSIAADEIAVRLAVPRSIALRTLAAAYQRASHHAYGPNEAARDALCRHLIQSAMCARRLAVSIEEDAEL